METVATLGWSELFCLREARVSDSCPFVVLPTRSVVGVAAEAFVCVAAAAVAAVARVTCVAEALGSPRVGRSAGLVWATSTGLALAVRG